MLFPLIISFTLLSTPEMQYQTGIQLSKQGASEESELFLKNISPSKVSDRNLYHFCRLLNNFRMNNKTEADKQAKLLEDGFIDNMPRRYQALTTIMMEDLKGWKKDDLGDIARDMNQIGDRLKDAKAGEDTQKLQHSVVARLDKLIKQMEDQQKAAQDQANSKGDSQGQQKGDGTGQGPTPMDDSKIGNDSGPGKVDSKRLRGWAEQWGKLPEKEQAKAMAELTRNMPPEYRDIIERYFKDLAKANHREKQ